VRLAIGLPLALAALAGPRPAQDGGVQLRIVLPGHAVPNDGPSVASTNLLADRKTRDLLRSGFPARMHYRTELWRKSGLFDDLESATEWDVFVSYEPARQLYKVVRKHGNQLEDFGGFATLTSAETVVGRPYHLSLRPRHRGQHYYYTTSLDVQALDVTDLDELQRWLHGDFQPAVQGRNNPATALTNGIGTLISRVLGGERRRYDQRSEPFTAS
jgi:hypothetical protein